MTGNVRPSTAAAPAAVAFFAKMPARWRAVASAMPAYRRRGFCRSSLRFAAARKIISYGAPANVSADAAFAVSLQQPNQPLKSLSHADFDEV